VAIVAALITLIKDLLPLWVGGLTFLATLASTLIGLHVQGRRDDRRRLEDLKASILKEPLDQIQLVLDLAAEWLVWSASLNGKLASGHKLEADDVVSEELTAKLNLNLMKASISLAALGAVPEVAQRPADIMVAMGVKALIIFYALQGKKFKDRSLDDLPGLSKKVKDLKVQLSKDREALSLSRVAAGGYG